MIRVGIVVRRFSENVDPDASLFELFGPSLQRTFHYMPQETGIAPAVSKDGTGENAIYLLANRAAIKLLGRAVRASLSLHSLENGLSQSWTRHEEIPLRFGA
jgi:hypothetical protein